MSNFTENLLKEIKELTQKTNKSLLKRLEKVKEENSGLKEQIKAISTKYSSKKI
jgi:hypothetical protein